MTEMSNFERKGQSSLLADDLIVYIKNSTEKTVSN